MRLAIFGAILFLGISFPAFSQDTAHPPSPRDIASWMQGDNYPTGAFRAHAQGRVAFTLTIGPNGHPSACRITQTSGNADLDKATCDIFKRGRFNPAVDNNGTPIAGEWSSAMNWQLPE